MSTRRSAACSALLALLLLGAAAAGAQSPRGQTPICLVLPEPRTREEGTIRLIMDGELTRQLQAEGFPVVPESAWREALGPQAPLPAGPGQAAAALQLGRQAEARVVVAGTIRIEGPEIVLGLRAYDVADGSLIFDVEERAPKDIGIYNQVASLARKTTAQLNGWVQALAAGAAGASEQPAAVAVEETEAPRGDPEAVAPAGEASPGGEAEVREPAHRRKLVRVTVISPDEGAEIRLAQQGPSGTIRGGRLELEAPPGSLLQLEKSKPGFRTDTEELQVPDVPAEITLRPLVRATRLALELFYSSSQFLGLGAGFRLYLVPDFLLLRADHYSYFSLGASATDGQDAYHGDFRLVAGSYLFTPPEARVRLGLASGPGVILSVLGASQTQPERGVYQDLYWDLLELWLDLSWRRSAVFLRLETKYALGLGNCLLERGLVSRYGPQYTIGWLFTW